MNCESIRELLGPYLDGELPDEQRSQLEQHIQNCPGCTAEMEEQRILHGQLDQLGDRPAVKAPPDLWAAIEQHLDAAPNTGLKRSIFSLFRKPIAAAASIAILIGVGLFVGLWLGTGTQVVQASDIDYSILLDGIAEDVDAAVQRFLNHYKAQPIARDTVEKAAPALSYAVPPQLPGGFQLEQAYSMRFGKDPGVAATYRRGDEPLVVFFHPPVDKELMGIHRHSSCIVAKPHGQKVEVGPWHLIHFTDPTTCHCLLSKLEEGPELYEVIACIAPRFTQTSGQTHPCQHH